MFACLVVTVPAALGQPPWISGCAAAGVIPPSLPWLVIDQSKVRNIGFAILRRVKPAHTVHVRARELGGARFVMFQSLCEKMSVRSETGFALRRCRHYISMI